MLHAFLTWNCSQHRSPKDPHPSVSIFPLHLILILTNGLVIAMQKIELRLLYRSKPISMCNNLTTLERFHPSKINYCSSSFQENKVILLCFFLWFSYHLAWVVLSQMCFSVLMIKCIQLETAPRLNWTRKWFDLYRWRAVLSWPGYWSFWFKCVDQRWLVSN